MRTLFFLLTSLSVIGLAVWAYHENYKTQDAIARTEALQRELGDARARLGMLRAEWAYLNRPENLRELADLNFDRLQLTNLSAVQFARVDQVSYPPLPEPEMLITNVVAVQGPGVGQ